MPLFRHLKVKFISTNAAFWHFKCQQCLIKINVKCQFLSLNVTIWHFKCRRLALMKLSPGHDSLKPNQLIFSFLTFSRTKLNMPGWSQSKLALKEYNFKGKFYYPPVSKASREVANLT